MNPLLRLIAASTSGFLLVREYQARTAAERMAAAALETLLRAIDANDAQTGRHVRRVARYALVIADAVGLDERNRRTVERVALFHDIGKIHEALFDITHDDERLTAPERRAITTHPLRGAEVLEPLTPFFPDLAEGVLSHHERWDGSGYPRGLVGTEIPFAARIVTLVDTFDAITHDRRYREGRGTHAAARVIAAGRGSQFDPDLVDLMLLPPILDEMVHLRHSPLEPDKDYGDRREGRDEPRVPDISFRWREQNSAVVTGGARPRPAQHPAS